MQRHALLALAVWLSISGSWGKDIHLDTGRVSADYRDHHRRVLFALDTAPSAAIRTWLLTGEHVQVSVTAPNEKGTLDPNTAPVRWIPARVEADPTLGGDPGDPKLFYAYFDGDGPGQGRLKVEAFEPGAAGGDRLVGTELPWRITAPYNTSGFDYSLDGDVGSDFSKGLSLTGRFSLNYTSNLQWSGDRGSFSMHRFTAEGVVPLLRPGDVADTAGARVEATRQVPDFLRAAYNYRWSDGTWVRSAGLVGRATATLRGYEVVAYFSPGAAFLDGQGRAFFGTELEGGWRTGNAEWRNLTTRAPARGRFVARAGSVFEWAPLLGPVNRDLGAGVRFYLRGRGWLDLTEGATGKLWLRPAGFFDTELFYAFDPGLRAFVRYQLGQLPPDLRRSVSFASAGIGKAF